jgi:hypothetical protein
MLQVRSRTYKFSESFFIFIMCCYFLRVKMFELFPLGFIPKSKETTSICLRMVSRVPTHLDNESNLEDTNIDDNIDY